MRNKKGQFVKGYHPKTEFKKGHNTWNKGEKGVQVAWNKGIKRSSIVIAKIREKAKERYANGLIVWNKGKKGWTKGTKAGFRKGNKFGKFTFGMKGKIPWNKGMRSKRNLENEKKRRSIDCRLWRKNILKKDNWTCQKTGIKKGKLNAHHIQNFADFPELRFDLDNGIILSEKVHQKFHKIYGKRNNTKEQLREFLNKKK